MLNCFQKNNILYQGLHDKSKFYMFKIIPINMSLLIAVSLLYLHVSILKLIKKIYFQQINTMFTYMVILFQYRNTIINKRD